MQGASPRKAVLLATLVVVAALPGVARADTLLETITVPADNASPPQTSTTTLTAGRSYKFVARGTFLIQSGSGDYDHDAIYCYGSTNGSLCNPPEVFGEKLTVGYENEGLNGFPAEFGTAPEYNAGHTYAVTFEAPETGRVRFFVGNPDGNTATGTLTVQIYRVDAPGGGGGPTGCPSALADECATKPWFSPVRHPQRSKSRKQWNAAEVTFNLAAGDYADATSPPLLSNRQKRAILDIRGVDDKDIAAFADSKFRRWGRAACVAVAGHRANLVLEDINRSGLSGDSALARNVIRWAAAAQLETCLEMLDRGLAAEQKANGATAGAAAGSCASRVSIKTVRSRSKLITRFPKRSAPSVLKVACRKIRGGIRVTVKPRKKGASLKSVVGRRLHVGLMRSTTARTGNEDLGVKFKR